MIYSITKPKLEEHEQGETLETKGEEDEPESKRERVRSNPPGESTYAAPPVAPVLYFSIQDIFSND